MNMGEFFRIFQNEWIKLLRRRRFVVVLLLGLALISFYTYARYHEEQNQKHYNDPATQIQMMDSQIKRVQTQLDTDKNLTEEQKKSLQEQLVNMEESKAHIGKDNPQTAPTKEDIQRNIDQIKSSIASLLPDQDQQKGELQIQLLMAEYQLAHPPGVPNRSLSSWDAIQDLLGVGAQLFFPLLCVLLVADMVSGEQTGGTIKLLLTRPASRIKILFAKYVTAIIGAICIHIIILGALTGGLLAVFGSHGATNPVVVGVKYEKVSAVQDDGRIVTQLAADATDAKVISARTFTIQSMLLTLLSTIGMCALGFFCSVLVRSAAVSTGISIAVIIIGTIIINAMRGTTWLKYFLTPHFDLPDAWTGSLSKNIGFPMSLTQSLIITAAWVIGMYVIGHYIFKKRDILA
jgi:ABC-2 type transport system permease protein